MRSIALLLALAATLAGCATPTNDETEPTGTSPSPATATPSPSPGSPETNLVHSVQEGENNVFDPVTLTIASGATVTWDIVGPGHHTVDFLDPIDADGNMPKSGDMGPDQTFDVTFMQPGTYDYYCKYHSNKQSGMIGTIIVE